MVKNIRFDKGLLLIDQVHSSDKEINSKNKNNFLFFFNIQNSITIFCTIFLILNTLFSLVNPITFFNSVVGICLLVNLAILSIFVWKEELEEIKELAIKNKSDFTSPFSVILFNYMYPILFFFPVIAFLLAHYVIEGYLVLSAALLISFIVLIIRYSLNKKYLNINSLSVCYRDFSCE